MNDNDDQYLQPKDFPVVTYPDNYDEIRRKRMRAEYVSPICPNPMSNKELMQILTETLTDKEIQHLVDEGIVHYENDED